MTGLLVTFESGTLPRHDGAPFIPSAEQLAGQRERRLFTGQPSRYVSGVPRRSVEANTGRVTAASARLGESKQAARELGAIWVAISDRTSQLDSIL